VGAEAQQGKGNVVVFGEVVDGREAPAWMQRNFQAKCQCVFHIGPSGGLALSTDIEVGRAVRVTKSERKEFGKYRRE
jgi:hypothetical protein